MSLIVSPSSCTYPLCGDRIQLYEQLDVADRVAVELHVQLNAVTAQRVVSLGPAIRGIEPLEVPRVAVVVEDDLLVQIAEVVHHPAKRLRTIRSSCSRSGATCIRPRISAANPYVSKRRASSAPMPRLFR